MSNHIHEDKVVQLEELANQARELLIEELVEAGSGHTAGPLGINYVQGRTLYDSTIYYRV